MQRYAMTTLALPMTHEEFRALPEPEGGATLELVDGFELPLADLFAR